MRKFLVFLAALAVSASANAGELCATVTGTGYYGPDARWTTVGPINVKLVDSGGSVIVSGWDGECAIRVEDGDVGATVFCSSETAVGVYLLDTLRRTIYVSISALTPQDSASALYVGKFATCVES